MSLPRTGPLPYSGPGLGMLRGLSGSTCIGMSKAIILLCLSGLDMPLWFYLFFSYCFLFPLHGGTWILYEKLDSAPQTDEELKIMADYIVSCHQLNAYWATLFTFGPGRKIAYWPLMAYLVLVGSVLLLYLVLKATNGIKNFGLDVLSTIYKVLLFGVYTVHSFVFFLVINIESYLGMLKIYIFPWALRKIGEFTEALFWKFWRFWRKSPTIQYRYKQFAAEKNSEKVFPSRAQIRLLRIPRQTFFGHLKCSLEIVDLDSLPAYEALSYHWGFGMESSKTTSRIPRTAKVDGNKLETIEKRLIFVDGCQLMIPRSSYELLHARSSMWHSRLVWIDAICINQEDKDEKAVQVSLMGSIYSKVRKVTVWPGDRHDSGMASAVILRVLSAYGMLNATQYEKQDFFADEIGTPGCKAFVKLLQNPYFTMVWVVQEIAVGSNVQLYHGGRYIPWDIFTIAYMECVHPQRRGMIIGIKNKALDSPVSRDDREAIAGITVINGLRIEYSKAKRGKAHIGHLLADCVSMHATDPRDRIFALNGLLIDSPLPESMIGYKKTHLEAFTETASYALKQRPDLFAILAYAGIGWRQCPSTLPTWVPDWTEERINYSLWERHHSGLGQCTATHLEPDIEIIFGDTGPILATRGIIIDKICRETHTVSLLTKEYKHKTMRERGIEMARWYKEASVLAETEETYPYSSQSRREVFWRTIVADRSFVERPAPDYFELCNMVYGKLSDARLRTVGLPTEAHVASLQADPELSAIWPQGLEGLSQFHEFQAAISHAADGRKFSITNKGYMCLTATGGRINDLICIIFGAPTPFVLREYKGKSGRYATGKSLYQLVGECYVHGLMDRFDAKKGFTSPMQQVFNIV